MNTTRDPRLPRPMDHAREVAQLEHQGQRFQVGQRIAYDVRVYEYKKDRTHDERQEAVIVELWIEDWHGRDLPYAECLTDNETASRVWFHRDNAGTPTGVTGPVPANALF